MARDLHRGPRAPRVADFFRGLTPRDLDYLRWSYEYDPPLDTRIQHLTELIAQLLAGYANVNRAKDAPPVPASDYLRTWDAPPPDPDVADAHAEAEAAQVLDTRMPGATPGAMGLIPGRGAAVPSNVFALFAPDDDAPTEE